MFYILFYIAVFFILKLITVKPVLKDGLRDQKKKWSLKTGGLLGTQLHYSGKTALLGGTKVRSLNKGGF